MMTNREIMKACLVLTGITCLLVAPRVESIRPIGECETIFDVTKHGARADGVNDDGMSFVGAWVAACKYSKEPATVLIPKGNYMAGEVIFSGPCAGNQKITVQIDGNVTANPDSSLYVNGNWFLFQFVDNVVVTGLGTLTGRGAGQPPNVGAIEADIDSAFAVTLFFDQVGSVNLNSLKLVNSSTFHTEFRSSHDIQVSNLTISSPGDSFDTVGIYLSNATNVNISGSTIATGDDCISIGQGSKNVTVTGITCGPGHGISIGSLGKESNDMGVEGVRVTNCTMVRTTNGARIKTFMGAPAIEAKGITFKDIIMQEVANPIIIDQHYTTGVLPSSPVDVPSVLPSLVKISDTHFVNIRGTTTSPLAINLNCSTVAPCEGIELTGIDLAPVDGATGALKSALQNAKTLVNGVIPPAAETLVNGVIAPAPAC